MHFGGWQDWIAWAGIVIPLSALAWSAFQFASAKREDQRHRRFEQFFSVTDKIGQAEGSLLSKVAALYELRRFPEYADVIVRMTQAPEIVGGGRAKEVLAQEFRLTNQAMRKHISNSDV